MGTTQQAFQLLNKYHTAICPRPLRKEDRLRPVQLETRQIISKRAGDTIDAYSTRVRSVCITVTYSSLFLVLFKFNMFLFRTKLLYFY